MSEGSSYQHFFTNHSIHTSVNRGNTVCAGISSRRLFFLAFEPGEKMKKSPLVAMVSLTIGLLRALLRIGTGARFGLGE